MTWPPTSWNILIDLLAQEKRPGVDPIYPHLYPQIVKFKTLGNSVSPPQSMFRSVLWAVHQRVTIFENYSSLRLSNPETTFETPVTFL